MINRTKNIIKQPIFKALIKLAFPIILANLFQSMYHLTDSFWVGRLGATALAAVSITSPVIFFTFTIGLGFAIAGSTFVAQYFGAKNHKMVSHAASQTILMILFTSLLFGSIGYILAPKILTLMGANNQIFNNALSFLRFSFIAVIFNFSFFIFQAIMRAIGRPKIPAFIILGTVLLNFALDPILIFGWKSIPAFGIQGAVFATILTQSIASIIGFSILFSGKYGIHLKIKDFIPDFKFIKKAFIIGLPSSIEHSSRNLTMIFITSIIASFGTIAIASYGAGSNIIQISMFIGIGLAVANSTLVGQNIGAGRIDQAVKVSKLSALIAFIALFFTGLLSFIFAKSLISFFIPNDPLVIAEGAHFVRIVSLSFAFVALHMSFAHVFIAVGQTKTTMFLSVISQWLFQIPLAFLLSQKTKLGLTGVWIAMPITNTLTAFAAFILYKKGNWKKSDIIKTNKSTNQSFELK